MVTECLINSRALAQKLCELSTMLSQGETVLNKHCRVLQVCASELEKTESLS